MSATQWFLKKKKVKTNFGITLGFESNDFDFSHIAHGRQIWAWLRAFDGEGRGWGQVQTPSHILHKLINVVRGDLGFPGPTKIRMKGVALNARITTDTHTNTATCIWSKTWSMKSLSAQTFWYLTIMHTTKYGYFVIYFWILHPWVIFVCACLRVQVGK